jgi:FMN reductase
MPRPYIVGLGGTTRAGSSTQRALSTALDAAKQKGADTLLLCGSDLDLPAYTPGAGTLAQGAQRIVAEIRRADGIILGTPGYHGGISGLVKNVLDYTEELKSDQRPYLEGRAVGCIVTAAGAQGGGGNLDGAKIGCPCVAWLADAIGCGNCHSEPGLRCRRPLLVAAY